jgi:superfamily II DNA helicase RecQ
LYLELRNFALLASKRDKIRSYLVINKSIINEIIDKKPKRIEDLANIKGFGPKKVERYGLEILKIIKDLS